MDPGRKELCTAIQSAPRIDPGARIFHDWKLENSEILGQGVLLNSTVL